MTADRRGAAARHPGARHQDNGRHGSREMQVIDIRPAGRHARDRAHAWLRSAMIALAVLAAAAAAVSWDAQYVLVRAVKHDTVIAALEAGIPDVGALVFASLGVALALHGKRAIRARVLNVACVGISLAMNALASAPGWADLAIWVMPSAIYALASDTLIGVIRAAVIARGRRAGQVIADDEGTPIAMIGGLFLWMLRLVLAPLSTITGFRRWALDECPVAPGRKAPPTALPALGRAPQQVTGRRSPALPAAGRADRPRPPVTGRSPSRRAARPGKQARLLEIAGQRHDLTVLPLEQVSGIANQIGAEIALSPGTARRVLLAHVRALRNGQEGMS
jgi:hypothetical protein